jgi:ketosteroid isomerase-like protein
MDLEKNKQIVRTFFEMLSAGRLKDAEALLADDATWLIPGRLEISGLMSKSRFAELLAQMWGSMPGGYRITPKGITAEGNRVAIETEGYGKLPDGRVYNNQYHLLFEMRGDKISAVREYADTQHAKEIWGW